MKFKKYLLEDTIPTSINKFLDEFTEVHIFCSDLERRIGMSKFSEAPSEDKAFLFIFENEGNYIFHTLKMKFPINMYFFNEQGNLVYSKIYCLPEIEEIQCPFDFKYVIETTSLIL